MLAPRRDPEILLRRYWDTPGPFIVSAGLSALSLGYRVALAARAHAYRWRVLKTARLPCPVLSVGNITVGGSGKTPVVELVVQCLRELGATPAVVSRGYGRQTRGVYVVADRDAVHLGARAGGDEPVLLAERLSGTPVVVGENRLEAAWTAVQRCGASAVVLDDGFQHRTLAKDLEIVVLNGRAPWGNRRLFPRGMLREPLSALRRADLFVLTNPPSKADAETARAAIRRYHPSAPVLAGAYEPIDAREIGSDHRVSARGLSGRRLLAFAGLGSPRGFRDTLTALGVRVAGLAEYPDHHWFTERDLDELARQGRAIGAEGLICTEKDAIRLRGLAGPSVPCWTLSVRLRLESDRDQLLQAIGRTVALAGARR
jgi:tetraacyldisaccharide 4'-kinase